MPKSSGRRIASGTARSSRSPSRTGPPESTVTTKESRPALGQRGCPFGAQTPVVSRGKPWNPRQCLSARKPLVSSDFAYGIGVAGSSCHAEGRGFESLQPLRKRPAFAGLFRGRSRLVRLRPAGPKPDPRQRRRGFGSKNMAVCREFWIVRTVDLLRGYAEGHGFDVRASPVSVRNGR
jgi:hypothetical protein